MLQQHKHLITVFVDIDGVLLDYSKHFNAYMASCYPSIEYDPLDTFPAKYVTTFQHSEHFANLQSIDGALDGVRRLRRLPVNIRLLSSSVNNSIQRRSRLKNLTNVFGGFITRDAVLLPSGTNKSEWLRRTYTLKDNLWRYILIDDHPMHVKDWLVKGCCAILLNRGEWSPRTWPIPDYALVASEWGEVERFFKNSCTMSP